MITDKQAFTQSGDKITADIGAGRKMNLIHNRKAFRCLATACMALIVTAVGAIFYNNHPKPSRERNRTILNGDVGPGSNKAVLDLADGSRILLGDADHGEIAEEGGISIKETKDGQLIYKVNASVSAGSEPDQPVAYHTISTPRGGQYRLFLPDGTMVWLNASSSLKFPVSLKTELRNVKLTGEAYFEVAEHRDNPFVVDAGKIKVESTGAGFNVMAYPDEHYVSTMPVEGRVKLIKNKESRILLPWEQARVTELIQVVPAGDEAIAWKNGLTSFRDADIRTIMRQVARWYDLEVNFQGDLPGMHFSGEISREANLSELIRITGLDKIRLKLEGKMITVMP